MSIRFLNQDSARFRNLTRLLIPLACFMVVLLPVTVFGQIRLHDPGKDELAKKTRDAYADFTKEDNTVFDKMISNTLELKKATLAHLMELNAQVRRDKVNFIPVATWKYLRDVDVPDTEDKFLVAYNFVKLLKNEPGVANLKAALADAKKQLEAKQGEKTAKVDALKKPTADLDSLKKSLESLKDAAAKSPQPIKNLSDLGPQFNNLKAAWSAVTEVKEWMDAAEKATNAPGLQLTILDLGVQHLEFEVERRKLDLEQATAAEARATRTQKRLAVVWGDGTQVDGRSTKGLFGQIYRALNTGAGASDDLNYPFVTNENEQVIQTIGRLAAAAQKETNGAAPVNTMKLRDLMDILSRYVSLVGYHKYLLLADVVEGGVDENLFSIRKSAINMREREMLVAHGLDGLVAYHSGGIKPEEIANFFRAVQSIAVGVMAGRK